MSNRFFNSRALPNFVTPRTNDIETALDDIVDAFDAVQTEIDGGATTGWKDMVSPLTSAGVPSASAPSLTAFGPAHTPQREENAFAINDYVFCQPFHVNHDIKPGGSAYLHVHWSTNGTNTGYVRWEMTITRAIGHGQAAFPAPTVKYVEQAASGTAWRHMVTEVSQPDALILTEPDELILVTVRRVAATLGADCSDTVFGLLADLHYQSDRDVTPNKAPNFYA